VSEKEKESSKFKMNRRGVLKAMVAGSAAVTGTANTVAKSGLEVSPDYSKGMYAVITGSGSALPDPQRGNASQAIVVDGTILQFDCGRRTMDNLMQAGINPLHVDYILFTHLHFDHIATYDYYVITSWIAGRQEPYKVFGPEGTASMSDGAINHMHRMDSDFVKELVRTWPEEGTSGRPAPEAPVVVKDIGPGTVVETDDFKVTAVHTPHVKLFQLKSLGYRVDSKYGSVVISGDTAPSSALVKLAEGADLLIHECVVPDFGMTHTGKFSLRRGMQRLEDDTDKPRTGHTSPSELGRLAQKAGVKKVVATHLAPYTSVQAAVDFSSLYYGESPGPQIWSEFAAAIKRHYDGPVILAEDAMVLKLA